MRRAVLALAFASSLGLTSSAPACSVIAWEPGDVIENPVFTSANGRFVLVARLYPGIPDFGTMTAGELFGLTDESSPEPLDELEYLLPDGYAPYIPEDPRDRLGPAPWSEPEPEEDEKLPPLEVAIYRILEGGARVPVAGLTLESPFVPRFLAVSDDGRRLVVWEPPAAAITTSGGGPWFKPGIAIHDLARNSMRRVEYGDILTADDIAWLGWARIDAGQWGLREHPNTGATALHLVLPAAHGWSQPVELDIDLETGRLLQSSADYYPPLGEVVVSATSHDRRPSGLGCASSAPVRTIDSQELIERAKFSPAPRFTEVAFRAGVQGKVVLDVVVGEEGGVVCARVVKGLPFGLDEAARSGLAQWWFEPLVVDGKAVRFSGLVDVEFRINRPGKTLH